jgi:hypothetical protein
MGLSFLSPLAALIGLAGLAPLLGLAAVGRRARRARVGLGLPEPGRVERAAVPAALLAVAALLAIAAAQPVVRDRQARHVRADAEAWFVLDTSRSMLARRAPQASTRLERARAFAGRLRASLGGVPVGIASLTDRVLPHLFPSIDAEAFDATLRDAIAVEQPPPSAFLRTRVSTLEPLGDLRSANFFDERARRRLLVVLTDGESRPYSARSVGSELSGEPPIDTIVVRFWSRGEHVYSDGKAEQEYRPDPSSATTVAELAAATGGFAFGEHALARVAAQARRDLGSGPEEKVGETAGQTRLAPWVSLAALLPLSFVLWRRNL